MDVDQQLLKDIGFTKGPVQGQYGWDHEVWVYEGYFWVHFTETMTAKHRQRWPKNDEDTIYVPGTSRKKFLELFLDKMRSEIREDYEVRDWQD